MPSKHRDRKKAQDHPAGSIEARIRNRYGKLPKSERKIADVILEYPGEVAAYSATELAALAGGSKAAVTRLIRRLGFAGFEEARRAARAAKNWGSPLYLMPRTPMEPGGQATIGRHVDQDIRNISKTFESLNPEILDHIAAAMWQARRVLVLGYRNSHFLAGYLRFQMLQVRDRVILLPEAGETLAEYLAELTEEDLLIAIGFRRRLPEINLALDTAIAADSKTLYVTDSTAQKYNRATWTLYCAVRGDEPFDRYTSAISLLHYLAVALMNLSGNEGRKRLKDIERLHERLHEFA